MGTTVSKQNKKVVSKTLEMDKVAIEVNLKKDEKIKSQAKEIRRLKKENGMLKEEIELLEERLGQHDDMISYLENSAPDKSKKTDRIKDLNDRNLPEIGDPVVSMWSSSMWQYFTATIESFDRNTLRYTIDWDDNDPTGREVDYFNLALDKVPSEDSVAVGSTVLFHQGRYNATFIQGVSRSGGLRWHQGVIEKVSTAPDGYKSYFGRHTKSEADGKWITYKDYNLHFEGYKIEDLRMPPNVFDILVEDEDDESDDEIESHDVYISYTKVNSPSAIANEEVREDLPPSYEEAVLEDICDPRDIAKSLKDKGVKVTSMEDEEYLRIVGKLKKSKVFIACLSDEYASNERCRMEFQFAKKTLKIPVIPVVVGTNSFQWQMTVVGLLIAGDLYIHFKNKDVEDLKMLELCKALKELLPELQIEGVQHLATGDAKMCLEVDPKKSITGRETAQGGSDLFFSYCWANSKDSFERKEISELHGHKFNDPRMLLNQLSEKTGMRSWMDVDRLSGSDEMGLIASGITSAKIVVCCVSLEYANSDNCRMELQFAVKSLKKPTIALIVGDSDKWIQTSIGKLILEKIPFFNLLSISNQQQLDDVITDITCEMTKQLKEADSKNQQRPKHIFRAPVKGDHVICLHRDWAYYMATVVAFDEALMSYTVDWDDGDPSGRIQSYQDLALNKIPESDSYIGIGTTVLFSQGAYSETAGNNIGGVRFHQGKITEISTDEVGIIRYSGRHSKNETDGKWISYKGYEEEFFNKPREELRLTPNAMDALMACRKQFAL